MGRSLYSQKRERFRDLLKQVRIEAGLTQVELSKKLKRPQSYVSDYERGQRKLDWVAVDEVLAICGLRVVEFAKRYESAR